MDVTSQCQIESNSWSTLMERRKKLAAARERFFSHTYPTDNNLDEVEIDQLAQEVVTNVLMELAREWREAFRKEQNRQMDKIQCFECDKNSPVAEVCMPHKLAGSVTSKHNESKTMLNTFWEILLPCLKDKEKGNTMDHSSLKHRKRH
ncbi:uncharacterized protein LOC121383100 [Gigantopelta aegis]|uniref:uncharacterized protein LOC121383100 n=1 Tax=Gigantopelta aegis TaxID=1735272 RepID=UPI001B88DF38|nr:uncharacterized protein LOC121383100 [Gigantopelta aegis]XP_041368815.1 uncharacterized protein LOC121383100 [Gigantopelta aegis]